MISRRINWVSSIDDANKAAIRNLESQLAEFYASNSNYYSDIDFTSNNWIDPTETGYQDILRLSKHASKICEVGCGSANILKHHPALCYKYSGCDFSQTLMDRNNKLYPSAKFVPFDAPNKLPFTDEQFDLVFSVFVIEHSTDPSGLIDECRRILKPGGSLVILCPDFLGKGRMTSQRSGFSEGTTSQKIKRGKVIDALVTFYDNRVRIPRFCDRMMKVASRKPLFLINLSPVMFVDKFLPDVDAVYITCKAELELYLTKDFLIRSNSPELERYESDRRIIFISGEKRKNSI